MQSYNHLFNACGKVQVDENRGVLPISEALTGVRSCKGLHIQNKNVSYYSRAIALERTRRHAGARAQRWHFSRIVSLATP